MICDICNTEMTSSEDEGYYVCPTCGNTNIVAVPVGTTTDIGGVRIVRDTPIVTTAEQLPQDLIGQRIQDFGNEGERVTIATTADGRHRNDGRDALEYVTMAYEPYTRSMDSLAKRREPTITDLMEHLRGIESSEYNGGLQKIIVSLYDEFMKEWMK